MDVRRKREFNKVRGTVRCVSVGGMVAVSVSGCRRGYVSSVRWVGGWVSVYRRCQWVVVVVVV